MIAYVCNINRKYIETLETLLKTEIIVSFRNCVYQLPLLLESRNLVTANMSFTLYYLISLH